MITSLQIDTVYKFAADIKQNSRIGKRVITDNQVNAIDDITQDILLDWCSPTRAYDKLTPKEFQNLMYRTFWFRLLPNGHRFKKIYDTSIFVPYEEYVGNLEYVAPLKKEEENEWSIYY